MLEMTFRDFDLHVVDTLNTGTVLFSVLDLSGKDCAFVFRHAGDENSGLLQVELLNFRVTTNGKRTFAQHVSGHDVYSIASDRVVYRNMLMPLLVRDGCLIVDDGIEVEQLRGGVVNYYINFDNGCLCVTITEGRNPVISFEGYDCYLQDTVVVPTVGELTSAS